MRVTILLALLSAACNRYSTANAVSAAGAIAAAGAATLLEGLISSSRGGDVVEVGNSDDVSDGSEFLPDAPGVERGPRDFAWHACGTRGRYRLSCPEWSKLCYVVDSDNHLWRCDQPGCLLPQAFSEWCHGR